MHERGIFSDAATKKDFYIPVRSSLISFFCSLSNNLYDEINPILIIYFLFSFKFRNFFGEFLAIFYPLDTDPEGLHIDITDTKFQKPYQFSPSLEANFCKQELALKNSIFFLLWFKKIEFCQ